jgi:hypothetical protein
VEIVHRGDRDFDRALIAERHDDAGGEAGQHVIEVIDIDFQGLAGRQRRALVEPPGAGGAGEIAEDREAKGRARRRTDGAVEAAKTGFVIHSKGSGRSGAGHFSRLIWRGDTG